MEKILVVDDDANHAKVVARALESKGYEITIAPDGQAGIDEMEKTPFDLVLTDLMMPGVDGMGVLNHVVTHSPSTLCMILTGFATVRGAVEAIKVGALLLVSLLVGFSFFMSFLLFSGANWLVACVVLQAVLKQHH